MRRVTRPTLPAKANAYLAKRHGQVTAALFADAAVDIDRHWKSARGTKTVCQLLALLQNAMGPTQRCMYCVDSHGSDIEHFWPKTPYPHNAFQWSNWLLCCTECGRIKGARFPLSPAGQPMLIDPTLENPWDFLDFDPATGNITARYDLALGSPAPRGVETVNALSLDRREGLAEAYKRTFRRLANAVQEALDTGGIIAPQLIAALQEKDDHGLLGWCFTARGATRRPFTNFQQTHPAEWAACAAVLT